MKEPVPPRPAAPTETSASDKQDAPEAVVVVPSMVAGEMFKPIERSSFSRDRTAVMGQVRKRVDMDMENTIL